MQRQSEEHWPDDSMPDSVRIAGRNVELCVTESGLMNDHMMGLCRHWHNQILIESTLAWDQRRLIAVHEVIHDFGAVTGVELEERDVIALAGVMFACIRDNPEFVAWLQRTGPAPKKSRRPKPAQSPYGEAIDLAKPKT